MTRRVLSLPILAALIVLQASCDKPDTEAPAPQVSSGPRKPAFPPEMAPFRERYLASALPYTLVSAQPGSTLPWQSKFLGHPYVPKGAPYPVDRDGQPLKFLAQLNFDEMPPLDGYPERGILQFFIAPGMSKQQVWGMLMDTEAPYGSEAAFAEQLAQHYFRVIYYEQWDDDASLLEPKLPEVEAEWFPIDREARLSFVSATGHVLNDDYRFASVFGSDSVTFFERFGQDAWPVADQYYAFNYPPAAAWVGGYAAFAQWDPREGREDEDWLLLLEIDSSSENGLVIMWGDAGVATFLIRREDLRQKNFSKVLYYWDSH